MGKEKAAGHEQICRKQAGKWRCKNVSSDNKFLFCEKHYKDYKALQDFCRNRSKLLTKKKTGGYGEVAVAGCSTATGVETRGSKSRNKVMDQSLDEAEGIQPPTAYTIIENGSADIETKRENVERTPEQDFLTESPSLITPNKLKKKKKNLPQQFCCQTGGGGWRCKNFRMSHGDDDSVPKTNYCEKHYNYYVNYYKNLKKRSGDGDGAGCSTVTGPVEIRRSKRRKTVKDVTGPVEIRRSKRRKTVKEEDETGEVLPATSDDTSNTIIEGHGSAEIGTKREKVLTIGEPVVELESLEHYKNKFFELRVELEKQKVELEKKNTEFTILRNKYAELESRKAAAKAEDAVEYWRNKCSDLETLVLKMETENSTMRCEVARVSNLESLVPRCEGMRNYEKIESEGRGLQNDTTDEKQKLKCNMCKPNAGTSSGGRKDSCVYELKTREKVLNVYDVDVNKHHEPDSEFPEYSAMSISSERLHLASWGENYEEGKGLGCSEGRPFQHGSSSQDHSEMTKKTFVNLVSDSDDESEEPLDMLATKNWNRNKHEMKWKSEDDMISSFEADPVLCMRAVCVLYRHEISEDEISPKGLVIDSDTLRCTTLAKFLMGEDRKGDLKKSVAELDKFDSNAVSDCKKLVRRYSIYLFDIYENRKDPFFLPATTASNGDQTVE